VEFMSRTYALEREATERYAQFAAQLEANGDGEWALLLRQLAEIEDRHAKRILITMGWTSLPAPAPARAGAREARWFDELPRAVRPQQALELALRREVLAQKFFAGIASGGAPQRVRKEAAHMATEEQSHARLIVDWLARVPRPASGGARRRIGL